MFYSFTNGTWQLRCSSTAGGACTGTITQPFYLTSSVKFIQIPPQIPEPVSKYASFPFLFSVLTGLFLRVTHKSISSDGQNFVLDETLVIIQHMQLVTRKHLEIHRVGMFPNQYHDRLTAVPGVDADISDWLDVTQFVGACCRSHWSDW